MKYLKFTATQGLRPPSVRSNGEPPTDLNLFNYIVPATLIALAGCGCQGGGSGAAGCSCGGQGSGCSCGGNSAAPTNYIFVIGSVRPVFPSLSVEKEFYQAVSPADSKLPPSEALFFKVFSQPDNLYIAREVCWVLTKDRVDSYLVKPRSDNELLGLIASIAPRGTTAVDFDIVSGILGNVAGPNVCNGMKLPIIVANEAFNFTDQQYIAAIAQAANVTTAIASSAFYKILQLTDNSGNTDDYRAINFVVVRYMGIYQTTIALQQSTNTDPQGYELIRVSTQPAAIQGSHRIVDVIFTYRGNTNNVAQQYFCSVDVTGEFPYLLTPMTKYYVHP